MCICTNRRHEEIDRGYEYCARMDTELLIGDMNTKVGWECECNGLHVECNDLALKVVNFASVNNVLISNIMFEHENKNKIHVNHKISTISIKSTIC